MSETLLLSSHSVEETEVVYPDGRTVLYPVCPLPFTLL